MNIAISPKICRIAEVCDVIKELLTDFYKLGPIHSDKIIKSHLVPYIDSLKDHLYVVVEFPYVDKMYRDAYYHYYSSKLGDYHRESIRLSFFNVEIFDEDFRNAEIKDQKLSPNYLGFIVLRPTFPKIIGRTALSPKAKKNDKILCCLAKINVTANGVKFKVEAYPASSQDNQTITCAETTIWAMLEYFGNKFPDYKPILPSAINKILYKFSFKRQVPSDGLTAEQVTYAIRELGFGAMIYSKVKHEDEFNSIISMYIESGIPVVGVLTNGLKKGYIGHAVNIVGKQLDNPIEVAKQNITTVLKNGVSIIDYNRLERNYVFVDDNHPPYQVANLNHPCKEYYKDPKWHICEIRNIIVPLHPRIYLDATRARKNFYKILESQELNIIKDTKARIVRFYICASRSYKEYVALNPDLGISAKEIILSVPMPKFIWVAEISEPNSFKINRCNGFLVQDATEPLEYSDKTMLSNHSILAGFMDGIAFRQDFGSFKEYDLRGKNNTFANPFQPYTENLR